MATVTANALQPASQQSLIDRLHLLVVEAHGTRDNRQETLAQKGAGPWFLASGQKRTPAAGGITDLSVLSSAAGEW